MNLAGRFLYWGRLSARKKSTVLTSVPVQQRKDGSYEILLLPPGKYLVKVEAAGFIFRYYGETAENPKGIPVTVIPPEDTSGIDFVLGTGASISGHISILNGEVPAGTKIEVFKSLSPDLYAFAFPDEGSYSIGGAPDGNYKVRITASGYTCQWNGQPASKQQAKEIVIKNANTVAGVDFTLVADNVKPTIKSSLPAKNAVKVKVNSPVKITFSEEMNASSVQNGFFLYPPAIGKLDLDGNVLTFTPQSKLAYGTTYTLTLASDIQDTAGNMVGALSTWNFSTEAWPTSVITRGSTALAMPRPG